MVLSAFVNRMLVRILAFGSILFMAGFASNWQAFLAFRTIGIKAAIYDTILIGLNRAFLGVPDAVSMMLSGAGGIVVGLIMMSFPLLAMFIVFDVIFDIGSGLETPAPHVYAAVAAFATVFTMGYFGIGSSPQTFVSGQFNDTLNTTLANTTNTTPPIESNMSVVI